MSTIVDICPSFEVLAGQPGGRGGLWRAALARAFEFSRSLHAHVVAELRANRLLTPAFLRGRLPSTDMAIQQDFQCDYPMEMQSPFEGVDSIAGATWVGSSLFDADRDDALMKLRFDAGTYELPLHTHEHSDRVIVVIQGSGQFHYTEQRPAVFTGTGVCSISVEPGMVLVFTRGLLHTFSSPDEPLCLLSYHAPFIPLDDTRQYTLPDVRWIPGV